MTKSPVDCLTLGNSGSIHIVNLIGQIRTQRESVTAVEALVMALGIGYVDYFTGWETSLFVFYALPIFFVTWNASRQLGIALAVICGAIWFTANFDTHPYHSSHAYVWATINRLIYFAFVAIGGTAMRRVREEARAKIDALTRTRELEQEIVRSSERERMRIGQDLHDGVCQNLAAIDCATECLKTALEKSGSKEAENAEVIQKMLRETVVDARSLARGLFPVQLYGEGLPSALQDLVLATNQLRHTNVTLTADSKIRVESQEIATQLYRIAQEALSNAVRHSGGTHIAVSLREEEGQFVMTVDDDGAGLPVPPRNVPGMGLRTMSYRAQVIGADLQFLPRHPRGTSVRCTFPLIV